jgi:hypothetical protein
LAWSIYLHALRATFLRVEGVTHASRRNMQRREARRTEQLP